MRSVHATLVILALLTAGCGRAFSAVDFTDARQPRWVGQAQGPGPATGSFRVVSFNIKFSRNVRGAIGVLTSQSELRGADALLLQEMDHKGVKQIADALGLNYVYYPAARHPQKMKQDRSAGTSRADPEFGYFGAAILSPWPLEDDQKILLGRGGDVALKVAVAATVVRSDGRKVRVVSVHLPTRLGIQFQPELSGLVTCVLDGDCEAPTVAVPPSRWSTGNGNFVVAGDFNSSNGEHLEAIGRVFGTRGREVPGIRSTYNTFRFKVLPRILSFDHIVAGTALNVQASGVTSIPMSVSDHRPVWAVLDWARQ